MASAGSRVVLRVESSRSTWKGMEDGRITDHSQVKHRCVLCTPQPEYCCSTTTGGVESKNVKLLQ